MDSEQTGEQQNSTPDNDVKYFSVVGILLVLIIALLAVLWGKERSKRINLELQTAQLRRQLSGVRNAFEKLISDPNNNKSTSLPVHLSK